MQILTCINTIQAQNYKWQNRKLRCQYCLHLKVSLPQWRISYTVRRTLLNSAPTNACRQPESAHKRKIPLAYVRFTQSKFPFALSPEWKIEKQVYWAGFHYTAFRLLHRRSIIFIISLHIYVYKVLWELLVNWYISANTFGARITIQYTHRLVDLLL